MPCITMKYESQFYKLLNDIVPHTPPNPKSLSTLKSDGPWNLLTLCQLHLYCVPAWLRCCWTKPTVSNVVGAHPLRFSLLQINAKWRSSEYL